MKSVKIFCTIACVLLLHSMTLSAAGDWRQGIWNRDVSENLVMLNIEAVPVMTEAFKTATPWGAGFNLGFEHKMRPSIIHSNVTFGFGCHVGLTRYFGKDVNTSATGNELEQAWDKYKSFTNIPVLLDFNIYYNFSRSNIFFGVSAGVNMMLGERDARVSYIGPSITSELEESTLLAYGKEVNIVSIQLNENNVSLNHFLPTFRATFGYTWEISPDFRLRFAAGVDYEMKYSDEYKGFRLDATYIEYYHQHDSPAMLNPFVSVGLVYSL